MCVTTDNFDRSRAFVFLSEIERKFRTAHGPPTAAQYNINPVFYHILFNEMKNCNESSEYYSIIRANEKIDVPTKILENVDSFLERGERLNNRVSIPASFFHKLSINFRYT